MGVNICIIRLYSCMLSILLKCAGHCRLLWSFKDAGASVLRRSKFCLKRICRNESIYNYINKVYTMCNIHNYDNDSKYFVYNDSSNVIFRDLTYN